MHEGGGQKKINQKEKELFSVKLNEVREKIRKRWSS